MNQPKQPHILSISCHDLGRHLGCYGIDSVHTPNLDTLASSGVRFDRAFCAAPQCSPSRAALATGRYPHSNGVMGLSHGGFGWELGSRERHAAALLSEQGYQTHLFGLQHVTQHVESLGFDHVHSEGTGREVCSDVAAFLEKASLAQPLYVEVNLFEPHRPYDYGGVEPDASDGVFVPPYLPKGEAAEREMAALQGAVREVDQSLGDIFDALDETGLSEETLVVFTADHGIAMPRAKCTLYEPGIEIALLARWPRGSIGEGQIVSELISNIDVLPTLLEATGTRAPEGLQGNSFLSLLRGEPSSAREAIYAEKTFHSYYDPMRCIRTGRFKYIRNFETNFLVEVPGDVQEGEIFRAFVEQYHSDQHPDTELYDLHSDPREQNNLSGGPGVSEIEEELDAKLWKWMEDSGDPLLHGPIMSPTHRRALRN